MDEKILGIIGIGILAGLLICAWTLGIDGATQSSIFGLIGLIAGHVFGVTTTLAGVVRAKDIIVEKVE
jgi:uncharacterized membrane protein